MAACTRCCALVQSSGAEAPPRPHLPGRAAALAPPPQRQQLLCSTLHSVAELCAPTSGGAAQPQRARAPDAQECSPQTDQTEPAAGAGAARGQQSGTNCDLGALSDLQCCARGPARRTARSSSRKARVDPRAAVAMTRRHVSRELAILRRNSRERAISDQKLTG